MNWFKFMTLGGFLALVLPTVAPRKTMDVFDKVAFGTVIGIAIWSILGAPDLRKTSIELPAIAAVESTSQKSAVTQERTTRSFSRTLANRSVANQKAAVVCPASIQVVNLRQSAGLSSIVSQIPCGQSVQMIQGARQFRSGEVWVPVAYQGQSGWVAGRFLAQ